MYNCSDSSNSTKQYCRMTNRASPLSKGIRARPDRKVNSMKQLPKKSFCLIFALLLVFSQACAVSAADAGNAEESAAAVAVDEGYSVYIDDECMREAAEYFTDYFEGATGIDLPVTRDASVSPKIVLLVSSGDIGNGYRISESGGDIFIEGSDFTQLVRGMYGFLEKYAGVRYYTSEGPTYTKNSVTVPANENYVYSPYFLYTDTDWLSPTDVQYSMFNGLTGSQYRTIPSCLGKTCDYISRSAHTLTNQFCPASEYYEEHPEYFSVYRGIQTSSQLCLSNPEVLEIVKQEVFDLLEQKHDPDAPLQIVSLTQHDNLWFCTCPKCRATDRKYGSHAGTMLEFVNAVARAVAEKGCYDNVLIDTFAYQYTRTPPKGIVPEKNVIVRLCSIECCFSHALDDPSCKANKAFMDDLRGWSAICDKIAIWDYTTNYANFVGIFPDFGVLQRNMQLFAENNVIGIYEEGNYAMEAEGEFGELRSWLICNLFKDPYLDFDAAVSEFCNAYYGAAGPYIKEFIDFITEKESSRHLGIYQSMRATLGLSIKDTAKCEEIWQKALAAASGEELDRVKASMLSWRWYKMESRKSEFANPCAYDGLKEQLITDINAAGITRLSEMGSPNNKWSELYSDLYFRIYFLVRGVMKLLYSL